MRNVPQTFRIDDQMRKEMFKYCDDKKITPSTIIRMAIQRFLVERHSRQLKQ